MADLLASVLDAHGGLDAWRSVEGITAAVTMGGPFWRRKGWPTPTVEYTIDIDPRRLHAELSPFTAPDVTLRLDGDPERVELLRQAPFASRLDPRRSFDGLTAESSWRIPFASATSSATPCGTT